jgi:hypothetical protein
MEPNRQYIITFVIIGVSLPYGSHPNQNGLWIASQSGLETSTAPPTEGIGGAGRPGQQQLTGNYGNEIWSSHETW